MSRTDLDAVTLARSLRMMAGDGSIEWVMVPMQARVLLDVADMLDENAELRERLRVTESAYDVVSASCRQKRERINDLEDTLARHGLPTGGSAENAKLRELVREMFYAVHPCDRAQFLTNVAELGIEVGE